MEIFIYDREDRKSHSGEDGGSDENEWQLFAFREINQWKGQWLRMGRNSTCYFGVFRETNTFLLLSALCLPPG